MGGRHIPAAVTLAPEVVTMMRAHAERAWPEECVGALLSRGPTVVVARPLANTAPAPRSHFLVSARETLAAAAEADAQGLTLSGFYHSHPDGPAEPSAHDAASATPGLWTVIVRVRGGRADAPRAFRFEQERFIEGAGP